ncbi:endonuclease [Apibacter muscae]|uniref:Endonuclease n=1 Tax=Apibacter muscae TaxID=2509004 RepID=A0A563DIL9_9FLAO|nr:endonuclease [Apibacter muscae]TWP29861.1 endonuclease [Apibacter muscae]TWP31009.1 endonuclease [Apibacter muscae]
MKFHTFYIFIILLVFIPKRINAQNNYKSATIMFYNVENLYDTIKSADVINGKLSPEDSLYQISIPEDSALASGLKIYRGELSFDKLKGKHVIRKQILTNEFYYKGTKVWNSKKYNEKIGNLTKVISETGREETKSMPSIIGLAEIENEHVLQDLCESLGKKGTKYNYAHFNSFDARGVDVGLLYNEKRFTLIHKKRIVIDLPPENGYKNYTRDILLVEGLLDGEKVYFLVNHWPSRRGGEQKSLPKRIRAAEIMKTAMDSILNIHPNAKILAMGDFNDDPTSPSIKKILNTVYKKDQVKSGTFFNPAEKLFKKGMGTLAYNDSFNFFDQQIMSPGFINNTSEGYTYYKTMVFSPFYLISQEGTWKGYPFRSFSGDNYTGGYSDHFPIYTILVKKIKTND